MSEETVFHDALAKPSAERAAFLDAACAGQPKLRAAVEALLAAHEDSGSLLDKPPRDLGQTPLTNVRGSGRPYFVMELVNGLALNKFCDEGQGVVTETKDASHPYYYPRDR